MNPEYKTFQPRWYRRRIPIFWWTHNPSYVKFITRELTSVCIAYSALLLLAQAVSLARGVAAYSHFLAWLRSPIVILIHSFVLLAVVFHAITWLNLAPKALVVRLRGRRVPDAVIVLTHYLAWLAASALVVWMLLGR